MNDETFGQLLRDADASAPLPKVDDAVATRVRARLRRRQLSVRASSLVVLVCVAAIGLAIRNAKHRTRPDQATDPVSIAQLKLEAEQLGSEAAVHERVAQALLTARDRAIREQTWQSVAVAPDPLQRIDDARNLAAAILVRDADRMADDGAGARDLYRDAAELFPETRAGKKAAGMLKQGA